MNTLLFSYLPPYPTVPSHCSTSHTEQPCSTASRAEPTPVLITLYAENTKGNKYHIMSSKFDQIFNLKGEILITAPRCCTSVVAVDKLGSCMLDTCIFKLISCSDVVRVLCFHSIL